MFERIKKSRYIFWFATVPTLGLTGLFAVTFLYEYYVVGIKKEIEGFHLVPKDLLLDWSTINPRTYMQITL